MVDQQPGHCNNEPPFDIGRAWRRCRRVNAEPDQLLPTERPELPARPAPRPATIRRHCCNVRGNRCRGPGLQARTWPMSQRQWRAPTTVWTHACPQPAKASFQAIGAGRHIRHHRSRKCSTNCRQAAGAGASGSIASPARRTEAPPSRPATPAATGATVSAGGRHSVPRPPPAGDARVARRSAARAPGTAGEPVRAPPGDAPQAATAAVMTTSTPYRQRDRAVPDRHP